MDFEEGNIISGIPKKLIILVIAVLLGMAWHYGIIREFAIVLWDMLRDIASSLSSFRENILKIRVP